MKRLEIWFPTLMIVVCGALGIASAIHGRWVNLTTFVLVGITFGMHLHREIKARGKA